MKFAYFSASPIMQYGLMAGFTQNGQEVKLFPVACLGDALVTLEFGGKVVRTSYREQELINQYIDNCLQAYRPDYVILEGYQQELALAIVLACRKQGCGFIYWSIEDPVGFTRMLPVAKAADFVFTTTAECLPEYRNNGIEAHLLLFACDPAYHRTGVYQQSYDLDFAVQASWYPFASRVRGFNILLKPLLGLGLNYRIWGYNWDSDPWGKAFLGTCQEYYAGILPNSELPDLCASSKIILGFQCDDSSMTQTSMRNYEVLCCGGFYLCQYSKASEAIFAEGIHLELVRDEEEAVAKTRYYLSHDAERLKIARQGQAYVQSRHTYAVRVKEDVLPYLAKG